MFQAIKREYGYGCVIINQIASRRLLDCVCNRNAPGSAIRDAPRDVCLCTRKIKGGPGCMCVCVCQHHSPVDSYLCVCMNVNIAEQLRRCYFTVNLLLF